MSSAYDTYSVIGTVGRSGAFFSLGGIGGNLPGTLALFDVAKTPNGQFYGFAGGGLYRIDPSLDLEQQIKKLDPVRDANGDNILSYTLESTADGKLYAIGLSGAGVKLYQIDITNDQPVATSLGTLPAGFLNTGDLVFDAANNRFLATNIETSQTDAIGTKNQSLTQRTIDLTNHAGIVLKVDTVTKGDAAYNNNIGFYAVEDSIGTIKLGNGSTLKPGDANYAVEAVKSAVLRAAKIDSKLNQNITGGGIYAPVVVAQGSLDDFVSKNPTNGGGGNAIHAYVNYAAGNSDNFDHFKLTAPNTFAVEDMYGGGDKDYNDLIVNINVKTS